LSTIRFLADRTATHYNRLLARYCRLSVYLSVCETVTLCIVALRVGVGTWLKVVPACS